MSGTFGDLYQNPEPVLRWLRQPEGKKLLEALKEWRQGYNLKLREATDLVVMARAQGALEVLDRILNLREELGDYVVGETGRKTT